MSRSTTVWVDHSPSQVAEHLKKALTSERVFKITRLDSERGRLVGPINAATWGRIIELSFTADGGGSTVQARWRPRWWPQLVTWGQEDRDLAKLEQLLECGR